MHLMQYTYKNNSICSTFSVLPLSVFPAIPCNFLISAGACNEPISKVYCYEPVPLSSSRSGKKGLKIRTKMVLSSCSGNE